MRLVYKSCKEEVRFGDRILFCSGEVEVKSFAK